MSIHPCSIRRERIGCKWFQKKSVQNRDKKRGPDELRQIQDYLKDGLAAEPGTLALAECS
ncbi:MAG: hypothetical protein ABIK15_01590 [Pseudomonadota bacterium]